MDGTEVQVRHPRAHRPGRKAFVSGKKKQNTINTTCFSDHQGHPLLSGIVRPDRMRDRTCVRSEGIAEQFPPASQGESRDRQRLPGPCDRVA
ncbi:transposase family protein [Streptomyces sp. NPDC001652]|uniref:transposase family protein n=1 Tax=Streptomyces sp. NPDC001652 TaxID=3154393 RepID=UPI00332B2C5B